MSMDSQRIVIWQYLHRQKQDRSNSTPLDRDSQKSHRKCSKSSSGKLGNQTDKDCKCSRQKRCRSGIQNSKQIDTNTDWQCKNCKLTKKCKSNSYYKSSIFQLYLSQCYKSYQDTQTSSQSQVSNSQLNRQCRLQAMNMCCNLLGIFNMMNLLCLCRNHSDIGLRQCNTQHSKSELLS